MPLIAQRGERRLPFVQLSWLDTSQLSVYAATYTLQCAGTFLLAFATVSVDCFFVAIMVHVSAQLRILSSRINALGLRTNLAGSARNFERDVSGEASDIQRDMYTELRLCIQYHQDILRFVRYLDTVMSPLAMTQFISGVLLACVALFQATLSPDVSAVFRCAAALPTPTMQIYLYCWGAEDVVQQLMNAAYSYYALLRQLNSR
ncbi:odorant receptor Or2-like [Schistocerca piceifrons]|uniref:odorant receptor Or2-like n=1 Tax=Schistocerca piceifrons TaxID=274613 RepID=UPI001F5FCB27|nr:odorant receptor Or2-like [Schistocerca piceifrons]